MKANLPKHVSCIALKNIKIFMMILKLLITFESPLLNILFGDRAARTVQKRYLR